MATQPDGPEDANDVTDPGTERSEVSWDSLATMRPMSTQAVFRPAFDDSDRVSVGTAETEPRDHTTTVTRR